MKQRLDVLLVERGLAESREKAKASGKISREQPLMRTKRT